MARRKIPKTKTNAAKNKTSKNTPNEAVDQDDLKESTGRNNSSSNRKPSVMETLKQKSSDTYLNAVKISTNINNNSNNNSISSTSGPVEMTPSVNESQIQKPQQQQQTSSVSYNNDERYLHKKFKRIASATIEVNHNNNNKQQQETTTVNNSVTNHTKTSSSATESLVNSQQPVSVKLNDNSPLIKLSNNNFSSANNSHHAIINNNNLVNSFKVVQNHTTSSSNQQLHKSVPHVMTAYENYIITKEKLTHHQMQQIDAAKMNSSSSDFGNNNENARNNRDVYVPSTSVTFQTSNKHETYSQSSNLQQQQQPQHDGQSTPGRYVCPFCQLVCTKPSVLEKHIRAHTNERPYPCNLCGFAFKTKSNLHKHFKSRAHTSRERGEEPNPDDEISYGSDGETTDKDTSNSGLDMIRRISPVDERTSSPSSQQSMDKPYKPKFHVYPGKNDMTGSFATSKAAIGVIDTNIPTVNCVTNTTTTSTSSVIHLKPISSGPNNFVLSASAAESVKQHIQKLISQNSAIIDGVEPALQKKYHKITGINRSISVDNTISSSSNNPVTHHRKSSLSIPPREIPVHHNNLPAQHVPMTIAPNNIVIVAPKTPSVQTCQIPYPSHTQLIHPLQGNHSVQIIQQPIMLTSASNLSSPSTQQGSLHLQGPLNLATKSNTNENCMENTSRSRKTSQETTELVPVVDHPKNPERSIIKDLLLNSRTFGVVAEGETNETPFMCPTCKKVFQNADLLKYHTFCHCDGGEQQQQVIYEEQSPQSAPISPVASPHQYTRSNSIHMSSLPDTYPKQTKIVHENPARIVKHRLSRQKPDNIIINHTSNVSPVIEGASVEQLHVIPHKHIVDVVQAPLPSPGPLLGKTPLIDMYSMHRLASMDGSQIVERKMSLSEVEEFHHQHKRPRFNSSSLELSHTMPRNQRMFGGDIKILEKSSMCQYNSGGTMSSLSPNSDEINEDAPVIVRTGLASGGIAVPKEKEKHEKLPMTPKLVLTITPTLTITQSTQSMYQKQATNHFQFPPINQISGYNPLTLPPIISSSPPNQVQSIMHGGKLIPFVQGIPGPNTLNAKVENMSKKIMTSPKTPVLASRTITMPSISPRNLSVPSIKLEPVDESLSNHRGPKQSFNFSRIADNISPSKKSEKEESKAASVVKLHTDQSDVRIFNFENLIAKNEIIVRPAPDPTATKSQVDDKSKVKEEVTRPNKFLRPSSLPLKPGTFTPKQHHGITPTANTLPLISPETPRPSKTCVQQYHNGHAYTYLGLKCSTKPFYCTVNKPQPAYCVTQAKLSMYSNWQVYPESKPHPLHLKPLEVMLCYRSYFKFERNRKYTIANTSMTAYTYVNSSKCRMSPYEVPTQFNPAQGSHFGMTHHTDDTTNNGGSTVEEEYVRGRGRGKYICETCGIKCKKPSMLKKHIRTHTDERPHTCTNCNFSFKTKGNLTKHMKSKAHYKKCIELGIPVEEYQGSEGDNTSGGPDRHNAMTTGFEDDSDSDCDGDGDNDDTESDDNEDNRSRLPEHEAARCLLSLSMTPPATNLTNNHHQQPLPQQQPIVRQIIKEKINEPRLDEISCRRIITFAAPKTEFDLHGQYYSDPNLIKINERSQQNDRQMSVDDDCPIDLTKRNKESGVTNLQQQQQQRKQMKPKMSDVVTPIGTASLLASLVSITDKFPVPNMNGDHERFVSDQTGLPHKYITDQALLDTKSKQSQMKLMGNVSSCGNVISEPVLSETMAPVVVIQEQRPEILHESGISMMDTLAEVAASSVKLDVTPNHSPKVRHEEKSNIGERDSKNFSAKSIASEFLKLTQNAKNHEKSSENEADAESGSDQDALLKKLKSDTKPAFMQDEGRKLCHICKKVFPKQSALNLHLNIHAMERKYKCDPCGQGFRTQGHLQKHNRSQQHQTKVSMTSTFGVPSQSNPRPFKCIDCNTQFRIHGHLAKHLRSKLHVMRLECLQKVPFGTYVEIERANISLTNIDTSDCETSLRSLQEIARKIHENDPSKLIPVDQSKASGGDTSMNNDQDDDTGTGNDSDDDYGDSDDGQEMQSQEKEPVNGLKRPYAVVFNNAERSPVKFHTNSDSEKSLQDPLKLDTPPPRPASAFPAMHHETYSSEKRLKTSDFNDT